MFNVTGVGGASPAQVMISTNHRRLLPEPQTWQRTYQPARAWRPPLPREHQRSGREQLTLRGSAMCNISKDAENRDCQIAFLLKPLAYAGASCSK